MSRAVRGNPPPQHQTAAARQNEYFVPRDGIDREVITADICRYLGNDALVRPGTYEHPDGRLTQGYFITAYRNLTSAMIQDLKADSARWDAERRAASRSRPGVGGASIPRGDVDGYRSSEIHQQRQHYGPTADGQYADPMAVDPPSYNYSSGQMQPPAVRYPGTGNSGYNGVNSSASYASHQAAHQPRYEAQPAAYSNNPVSAVQYSVPQQSYSPGPPDVNMYGAATMTSGSGMVSQAPFGQVSSAQDQAPYVRGAAFAAQAGMNPMVTSSAGSSRNMYATAGGAGYPTPAEYGYAQTGGVPVNTAGYAAGYTQPQDILYGRGNQNQTPSQTGYSAAVPATQYKEVQSHPPVGNQNAAASPARNSVGPTSTAQVQTSSSGQTSASTATHAHTRRDRDGDRHRSGRDADRDRDRDRDSDRHAAERQAHRHRNR